MGQIMQRLLEGVQAELQAEERDLCAHLNSQAHLLTLEAHLNCLEGSGSGFDGADGGGSGGQSKQAASPSDSPEDSVMLEGSARGKRRLRAGVDCSILLLPHMTPTQHSQGALLSVAYIA